MEGAEKLGPRLRGARTSGVTVSKPWSWVGAPRGDKPALQVNMGGGERFRKKMLKPNLIW
jgi:hypothetical protein